MSIIMLNTTKKLSYLDLSMRSSNVETYELRATFGEDKHEVRVTQNDQGISLTFDDPNGKTSVPTSSIEFFSDWCLGEPIMIAEVNGKEITIQVK